jgi:Type I restriction modification DNA specificity domain
MANSDIHLRPAAVRDHCIRVTAGGTPSRRRIEYFDEGRIPWVKTQELTDRVLHETTEHITEEALADSSAKLLPAGTVLVAMYGATAGQLGILGRPMACNQACCALVVDGTKTDARFLYYALLAERPRLKSLANGAAQQNLSVGVVANLQLAMPPLRKQQAIAEVLGALDDKIEASIRLVELTDELWTGELTKALNACDVVDGPLPSGWSRTPLSSLGRFVNGRNFTKGATGTGRMVVRIAELNSGPAGSTVYNEIDVPSDHVARPGDLLFAALVTLPWAPEGA